MIALDHEQRSPEWFSARWGVPSASNFDKIITSRGAISKQREKYLYQLAGERITETSEDSYQSPAMLRGCEIEDEAKGFYEFVTDEPVNNVGFCITEGAHVYGASPDGLVGDNGLLEIKCPLISTHVGYLLKGEMVTDYYQQVQGGLLVTGREWSDFLSYYPGMKPLIIRVHRDEKYLKLMKSALEDFCEELDQITRKLEAMK